MTTDEFLPERERMVETQIRRRGITDARVLCAMTRVPRHLFIPKAMRLLAYEDCALPIDHGQTISQPYIVALMTSLLQLKVGETVLEVGTGSGYQAAILSLLAKKVVSLEFVPALAESARERLDALLIDNVEVICADGSQGYAAAAPYDGILVTAAAPEAPPTLLEQLSARGRLVVPVGRRGTQDLQLWTRAGNGWQYESVLPVAFVPMRGAAGWDDSKWPQE